MKDRTNVITIEKNVPMPSFNRGQSFKYIFMNKMEIGDSFSINGDNPDYAPRAVRNYVYGTHSKSLGIGELRRKYAVRTLSGSSNNPIVIRVWRTQ